METKVGRIKLGTQGLEVYAQGLGCMSMSAFYGPLKTEPDMINLMHHVINSGVTFLDTSDAYGPHTNEILLAKVLRSDIREQVELDTKFGACFVYGKREIWVDPASVRESCEASLKRLGLDCIDLYYQLLRAHVVHPITAVQLEWSLWARDVEEEIVPTCRELGIIAYSPLGRWFFSSWPKLVETFSDGGFRKFRGSNLKPLTTTNTCPSGSMRWLREKGAAHHSLH
ncbi:hypothetical protein V6N13_040893 [Hibiscus sabdariffa]|uniref:NADP-dependent oxidoreductase domain-containing protein n=1 Tax=Hibiscus sabdariffa TaxID=183260 RepID=A0ABR2RA21_9ROSI